MSCLSPVKQLAHIIPRRIVHPRLHYQRDRRISSMSYQKPLVVKAAGRHTATVIVCHGLGDSGVGWVFLAEQFLQEHKLEQVKFIFPNAPSIPITLNGGMKMPGWYDITSLTSIDRGEDEAGVTQSKGYLHGLIKEEITAGIPASRIVLGGFSQGGAMSLIAGLTCPQKLGGVFALSSYMVLRNRFQSMVTVSGDANSKTPVFMGHGDSDPVVQYQYGKQTAEQLKEWGFDVDFKTYPGLGHSAAPQELVDIEKFLNKALPPLKDGESSSQGNL